MRLARVAAVVACGALVAAPVAVAEDARAPDATEARLFEAGTALTAALLPATGAFVLADSLMQVEHFREPGNHWPFLDRWPQPGWAGLEVALAAGDLGAGATWLALAAHTDDPQRARLGRWLGAAHLVLGTGLTAHGVASLVVHPANHPSDLDSSDESSSIGSMVTFGVIAVPGLAFLAGDFVLYARGRPLSRALAFAQLFVVGIPAVAAGTVAAMSNADEDLSVGWAVPALALGGYFTARPLVALIGRSAPGAHPVPPPVVAPTRGGAMASWGTRF